MARKKTTRKSKYQKQQARTNFRRERRENCVVESWTDKEAGDTYEQRLAHWDATREDRYKNDATMRGYGSRRYNADTGEVEDFTYNSLADAIQGTVKDVFLHTLASDDGSRQVAFYSLGIGILDLNKPEEAEMAEFAIVLLYMFRHGLVPQVEACEIMEAFKLSFKHPELRSTRKLYWWAACEDTGYRRAA